MRGPGAIAGLVWAAVITAAAVVLATLPVLYMTEYGALRLSVAAAALVGGAIAATLAFRIVRKFAGTSGRARAAVLLLFILMVIPAVSLRAPGRVTHASFGLTVYGFVPVPVLDVVVGTSGVLWFRDKSHVVTEEEVRSHLSPDVRRVIIGIGWHDAVTVEPGVREIDGVDVRILTTPEAFDLFNQSKDEGVPVLLIAHSTC